MRKTTAVHAMLSAAALLALGLGHANAAGSIVIALPSEPTSMDACDDSTNANARVLRGNVVEGLTRLDPKDGTVQPLLATAWKRIDGNTWQFTIRPGVTFHDGSPLNAKSVAFAINRSMNATLNCMTLSLFASNKTTVTEDGDMAVKITTENPDPILPARIAYVDLPSPAAPPTTRADKPVGTGPYVMSDRKIGQSMTLTAYPGYWGGAQSVTSATYVWRVEPSIRASMVKTGEADIAIDIPAHETKGSNVQKYATNSVFFLRPMLRKPPLDDLRVRQAVVAAIDKATLTEVLMAQSGTPTAQLVTSLVNGNIPGFTGGAYDLKKAKTLLAEAKAAGVPVETPITLIARTGLFSGSDEVAQALQQMLEAAGFKISLKTMESAAWSPWARKPDSLTQPVNLMMITHDNISGDASLSFPNYFGSAGRLSMADDPKLDDLLKVAAVAEGAARTEAYRNVAKAAYAQEILIPVSQMQSMLLTSKKVDYQANGFTDIELHLADVKVK